MNIFNNLKNKIKTSPRAGEVGAKLLMSGNNKQKNSILFRLFSFIFSVIHRRYSLLEVPRRRIHNAIAAAMSICVAYSNKVVDTHLPLPIGSGDKYDVDSRVSSRLHPQYAPDATGFLSDVYKRCTRAQPT